MTRGEDKIKDLFSDKLKDFQPEIPASLWAGIEDSLSEQQIVADPVRKRFSLRTVITVVSAAAAIVGAIFVADNMLKNSSDIVNQDIAQVLEVPQSEDNVEDQQIAAIDQMAQNRAIQPARTYTRTARLFSSEAISPEANNGYISGYIDSLEEIEAEIEVKNNPVTRQADVEEEPARKITFDEAINILRAQNNQMDNNQPQIEKKNKRRVDNFALGLSSSANVLTSSNNQAGVSTFKVNTISDDEELNIKSLYSGANESKMEHDQPISFGLTVSKGIAPNLSVETGIVYTFLSSKIKTTGTYEMYEKQKFHYLGVPVNLNYTFLRHRRLSSYVSVGGMIQKDIKGRTEGGLRNSENRSNSALEILNTIELSKDIKQDNPQFSVQTSLGVAYRIYQGLAVQARVGGTYYFNSSNEYRTIYTDRKFQLDLNLGLKWEF